jgi:hypothetical protein
MLNAMYNGKNLDKWIHNIELQYSYLYYFEMVNRPISIFFSIWTAQDFVMDTFLALCKLSKLCIYCMRVWSIW